MEKIRENKNIAIIAAIVIFVICLFCCGVTTLIGGLSESNTTSQGDSDTISESTSEDNNEQEEIIEPTPTPTPEPEIVTINILDLYNKPMSELTKRFGVELNQAGNLLYEDDNFDILIESRDGKNSTFVDIGMKDLGECKADKSILNFEEQAFSRAELEIDLIGNVTNGDAGINLGSAQYCDNKYEKVDIGLSCFYDGDFYSVSISNDDYCNL